VYFPSTSLTTSKVIFSFIKLLKQDFQEAVSALRLYGINADGLVCHVGNNSDRKKLIDYTIERYNFIVFNTNL
jgi:hypothetical protein